MVMETSPGDENINDDVKLCSFFNSNIAADLAKPHKDQPNGIIWMPICTQLRGTIPKNTKGITLHGSGTYDIFAKTCAHKHIICLQALQFMSICLQIYHSSQTRCSQTHHMFASQFVNPP